MCAVLINALTILIAAFLGALAAFLLQDSKNKRQEENNKRIAVNRAIFDLSMLWNALEQFRKEIIEPVRNTNAPWLDMQANISTQFQFISFNIDELFFLADTDDAQFLQRLYLEEMRYRIAIDLIKERSNIVLNRLQPKMEVLGHTEDGTIKLEELEKQLGPEIIFKLKSLTEAIIKFVDEDLTSMEKLNTEFTSAMEKLFKDKKILTVQYVKET